MIRGLLSRNTACYTKAKQIKHGSPNIAMNKLSDVTDSTSYTSDTFLIFVNYPVEINRWLTDISCRLGAMWLKSITRCA